MGTKGKTIGGGMPGPGKSIISGGHGAGKYGQPHKFYDKSVAKYKGPHKELVGDQDKLPQELQNAIKAAPGKYGMSQDHKMAYDRSEISRLKGDIHYDDMKKKGMSKYKKDAMSMAQSPMMKTDPKNESSKKQKNHVPGTHYGWADHKDKKGVRGGFNRAFKRAKAGGYDTFSFAYDKNKDNSVTHDEVKIYSTKTK